MTQRQGFPTHIHGEEIIGIVQGKKHYNKASTFQGMIDRNELLYNEEDSRYHLGLLSSWGMQGKESYPMITQLLEKGSELKVQGYFGEFTYDKPFYDPKQGMRTISSTAEEAGDYPGIDESEFDIILSEKCYPGDIISTDLYGDEEQLVVSECEESELNGEGWRATVSLTSSSSGAYYNPALLEQGISYYKINHVGTEYTTAFTGVDMPMGNPTGALRARFKLGGIRGVEGYVTAFADVQKAGMNVVNGKDNESERAMSAMRMKYANGDNSANTVIFGRKDDIPNLRATSLMEFLVERTLMKRTATSHMWQKQGQIKGRNGTTYLNEGIWHQLRRGKIITIPKIMGITKAHIAEAVEYTYRNNPTLPWDEREIVFEGGKLAEQNLLLIFQNEIQQQFNVMSQSNMFATLFGNQGILSESLRTSLVSGKSLNELEIKSLLRFVAVPLIGIAGKVTIKYNSALDHLSGNPIEFKGQMPGGLDWTAHSLIIWDVKSQEFSNNNKNIDGADTMDGGTSINDNLYIVRPEEGMTVKGYENGRWDKGKTQDIISSSKVLGQGFWAYNSSAPWMPYPEHVVIIELSKGARKTGSYGRF